MMKDSIANIMLEFSVIFYPLSDTPDDKTHQNVKCQAKTIP